MILKDKIPTLPFYVCTLHIMKDWYKLIGIQNTARIDKRRLYQSFYSFFEVKSVNVNIDAFEGFPFCVACACMR